MKYALRTLWKDRGFAAMAILSLAIGIGANTAIFSMVNGVLLRPLDFPDPQRLVAISITTPQFRNEDMLAINVAQLLAWRKRTHSFESIGAYRNINMSLTGDGRPELIPGARVSANFFDVLGVNPRLGRSFREPEDHYGEHQVVILADSLWRRRFGGDPSVIGRKITVGAAPYIVVGVLPPDFEFPKQPNDSGTRLNGRMEMFRPMAYEPHEVVPHNGDLNYVAIARLRPGVSIERARAELTATEAAIDAEVGG
ncbi:MAG TPA: ABC transporter permease, partial [Bryobacteraceae bacterium]|nr:ABC transporter permease [Bryobacteraceae bacterium]